MKTRNAKYLLGLVAITATLVTTGCGSSDSEDTTPGGSEGGSAGTAGSGGSSSGSGGKSGASGKAGAGGTAGKGGSSGTGGTAGKGGTGGTAGKGGTGGTAGKGGGGEGGTAGKAGEGGSAGASGEGGSGGASGEGGAAGTGGMAGMTSTGGSAGASGKGGASGMGGTSSTGGNAGAAGKGGSATGGSAGTAGAGGSAGATGGTAGAGGATGNGTISLPSSAIDFGPVDCGAGAPGNQTLEIDNTGTADLKVSASISGSSAFQLVGSPTVTIPAGKSGTFAVSASGVPSTATAGATIQATMTLASNDPANPSLTVPITETPHGATLVWVAPTNGVYGFGDQNVGDTVDSTAFTLQNSGNEDVTVTVGTPTDGQFGVTTSGGVVTAGSSLAGFGATFDPSATGTAQATVTISPSNAAICGASASSLTLNGNGVEGSILVSTSTIDFGQTPCSTTSPQSGAITLTNNGTGAFHFDASNVNTTQYALDTASGDVAPNGGTLTINVVPQPIPFPSPVPGSYDDTVTITTNIAGDSPHTIAVKQQAKGAVITSTKSSVTFSNTPVNSGTTDTFNLVNSGNADAFLALGLDPALTGSPTFDVTPATVDVSTTTPQGVTVSFKPSDNTQHAGGVTIGLDPSQTTVLCAPLPNEVQLTGTGLNGGLGLDKNSIDFQQVPCGSQANGQTVTLTNTGNASFSFTAAIQGADAGEFQVDDTAPTTLQPSGQPGDSVTLHVTATKLLQFPPKGITPYTANLVISTTIIGSQTATLPITLTPSGAILSWATPPSSLDFGNVTIGKTSSKDASLVNSGNASATASLSVNGDPSEFSAPANATAIVGSTPVAVTFAPAKPAGQKNAKLDVTTSDVLCAALPADYPLTGDATIGGYSDNGKNWLFGNDNGAGFKFCGSQATPDTLIVTNTGTADFNLTSVQLTTGTFFTATPSATLVPVGGSVNVTLASKPVPFPLKTDASGNYINAWNDTLTITTDIAGDTAHTYSLGEQAYGAIISKMSPTNLAFTSTQANTQSTFQFLVKNVGNQAASLTFALENAPDPWFSIPNIVVPASQQQSYSATFTPTNAQAYSDTASMSITGSTVLCDVLPAATQNNGIALSGTGLPQGNGVYSLSPASWVFGHVAIDDPSATLGLYCGSAAGADSTSFTITNGTVSAQTFTATATGGYTVSFPNGKTVGAGSQTTITVSTPALSATSVPGSVDTGVLTVVIGGNQYTANLEMVTAGSIVRFENTSDQQIMNLNVTYQFNTLNYSDFLIANVGNADVQVDRSIAPTLPPQATYNSDQGNGTTTFTITAKNADADDIIIFKNTNAPISTGYVTESLALHPGGGALCASTSQMFVNASN